MTQTKTIAKGSFWVLSSNLMSKLISFIYSVIIARLVLADDIGIFYLVLSILGILYIFTDLGIIYSLSRYVPYLYGKNEFGKLRNLVKLSYLGGGILTFVFSVLMFLFADNISEITGQAIIAPVLRIMSIWLILKEMDDINRGILIGRKKMKESYGLVVMQNFMKLILTIIAFYILGFNAEALSVGFLLSFLLVIPVGAYYVSREIRMWGGKEEKFTIGDQISLGKEVVSFGLIVTMISTLWTVIQYTDRVMLGFLTAGALEKIAVYSIALGLANLVLVFPAAIMGIFFPVVSEMYGKKDLEEMNKTLIISMKWLVMLAIPFALIMGIFGGDLLGLFYGNFYEQGTVVLLLFVIGLFLRSIFSLPQLILSAMRRLDVELKAMGAAAVGNVILNILFIPLWGINGAAFASMISFLILSMMIYYYSRKIYGFRLPKEIYGPLIAGLISLILLLLLKIPIGSLINEYFANFGVEEEVVGETMQKITKFVAFGLLFLLSVFIYFIALLALKSFGMEEIEILEAVLRKAKIPEKYVGCARQFLEAKWLKIPFLR